MALLRGYRQQGSLIAVTHNPEILSEADLVITLRDGRIADIKDGTSHIYEHLRIADKQATLLRGGTMHWHARCRR